MAYLLDSNVFIQAHQTYFAFEICPGFWDWLKHKNVAGELYTIENVRVELQAKENGLKQWADACGQDFFRPLDDGTHAAMRTVVAWTSRQGYKPEGFSIFMGGADPFLIAFALAHGDTLVTHETRSGGPVGPGQSKIKIPDVCIGLNVPCIDTYSMLRATGASFVMKIPG